MASDYYVAQNLLSQPKNAPGETGDFQRTRGQNKSYVQLEGVSSKKTRKTPFNNSPRVFEL